MDANMAWKLSQLTETYLLGWSTHIISMALTLGLGVMPQMILPMFGSMVVPAR